MADDLTPIQCRLTLVTGMHRSGTSAVAEVLQTGGLHFGPEKDLLPASPSNRRGHFELYPFVDFNDRLLAEVSGHWLLPAVDPEALAALADGQLGEEARSLVDEYQLDGNLTVKDPRFCLTIPFWNRAIGTDEVACVFVYRHPMDVAQSLLDRNGIDVQAGLYLWSEYVRAFLGSVAGQSVLPIGYSELMRDPAAAQAHLSHLGGWTLAPTEIASIVGAAHRHHATDDGDESGLGMDVPSLWRQVQGLTPGMQTSMDVSRGVDGGLAAGLSIANAMRVLSDSAETRVRELESQIEEREQAKLQELAEVRSGYERTQSDVIEERDAAREAFRNTRNQLEAAVLAREELERQLETLRAQQRPELLSASGAHAEGLRAELAAAQAQLSAYTTSRSGRLIRRYWNLRDKLAGLRSGLVGREPKLPTQTPQSSRPVTSPARVPVVAPMPAPVDMPLSDEPLVSIVIPLFGQIWFTAQCLASIVANTSPDVAYEVIVVDDVSPDRTRDYLRTCGNLRVILNDENLGYLRSTNYGCAVARGRYVCLLNNDTTVQPGWLSSLVELAETADDIGAVGSKLIYPDGTLQEAGAIIWSDGQGWNWGRNGNADSPEVNFVREVDYCSAASLLVRKDLWDQLGGFDERYVPAYYEDSDLAFGLRSLGYRVMYQPESVVCHHEGISHGTDVDSGGKSHQLENRVRFVEKWEEVLAASYPSNGSPALASWRGPGRRIFVFDHEVPAADHDSGSVRMVAILELLVEMGYKVTLFPQNKFPRQPYCSQLQQLGIRVSYGAERTLHHIVAESAAELAFCIVSRPMVAAEVIPVLKEAAPQTPIVYDMVDFHGLRIERRGEATGADETANAQAMVELERSHVATADLSLAITEEEAESIRSLQPDARVMVLPNIHKPAFSSAGFTSRNGVLFVGSFRHPPNSDAIRWLVDEIMPIVWGQRPEIVLHLVGSDMPADFVEVGERNIKVHGWVPDLGDLFNEVRMSVAPLRFGAGLKGKVGDSLARGVPVVCSPIGSEGFGPVSDALVVADTASELAEEILMLNGDPDRWEQLRMLGHELVLRYFGREAAASALTDLEATLAH